MKRRHLVAPRVLLAILAVTSAAAAAQYPWARPSHRPNVILLSIDTLRADHLGCYGYGRDTSPQIDAFSREAVLFEETIAAAPSTLASHASIFTSLVVPHHGASFARRAALSPQQVTLTEILHEHGYETVSWNGGGQIDQMWGLDQGFESYITLVEATVTNEGASAGVGRVDHLDEKVDAALRWLDDRDGERPFFLFLHTYEVHHPYTPDPVLRADFGRFPTLLDDAVTVLDLQRFNSGMWMLEEADLEHIVASYDAEVRSTDRAFGRLLDGLRERGLYDGSLIVVTSDHGEEFGEHERVGWHSHSLYDELLRVPLLVRLPRGEHGGTRVSGQVAGIDVAPTILSVLDIGRPPIFQGQGLLGRVGVGTAPPPERFVLSARDTKKRPFHALRGAGWKWMRYRGLYDLRADPGETNDLRRVRTARQRKNAMRRRADRWLDARPRPAGVAVEPDKELSEQLRALGYIDKPAP